MLMQVPYLIHHVPQLHYHLSSMSPYLIHCSIDRACVDFCVQLISSIHEAAADISPLWKLSSRENSAFTISRAMTWPQLKLNNWFAKDIGKTYTSVFIDHLICRFAGSTIEKLQDWKKLLMQYGTFHFGICSHIGRKKIHILSEIFLFLSNFLV